MNPLQQFFADHPEYGRGVRKVPGWLSITYTPLLANAVQVSGQVNNGPDAVFIATSLTITSTTTVTNAAYIQTPLIVSLVFANVNMTTAPVDVSSLVQTMPMHSAPNATFSYPLIIEKSIQINSGVTNPLGVDANVWITFAGFRAYT